MTAQAAWVSYPSTCSWTATGPGGTTTVSETLSTTAAPTAKPTISVSRSSQVAGQSFTTSWSTTDATSLTHVCTASGTGYTVNEALAVSGSRALTAQSGWVGYPSSCTWTANGAGGSATYTETMTTVAGVNSSVTYIYTDGLGSPVARTDGSGNVISRTRYEPYGYVASGVQPTIGFTGHVNDVDTGLTYMQQRYYDPVAGRFLSIDPVTTDVNAGNSFNRYVYASNNPYRYIDPDGRFDDEACRSMGGNCNTYGGSRTSGSSERSTSAAVGAALGSVVGGAVAAGCDISTLGGCTLANPALVGVGAAGGAILGASTGAILSSGSTILAKNIAEATNAVKRQFEASHHIVAENDPRAAVSRAILAGVNMDINSAFNGMNMSVLYHSRLHTNLYHATVEAALSGSVSYTDVAATLTGIRFQINMGTFPF
jgi:RHS repeat-associated protein